ncbi:hypothetical protein [uncultured Thioclava sp.]|uniref:hypothetical protein n=1 Tax=uncultured Thioclava sp. TaxID=473858 RepID=UPI0025DBD40A|nr:hypothetical protein [uncultured Thioclava sp.]
MGLKLACSALMVVPGVLFQKKMIALTQSTQGASTRASPVLHEAIMNMTVTTAHGGVRVMRI